MAAKVKMNGVNLDVYAGLIQLQEAGVAHKVLGPDGNEIGWTIVMSGPDSQRQKAARREVVDRRANAGSMTEITTETMIEDNRAIAAKSIISWSPDPIFDGQSHPYDAEIALKILEANPFIADQLVRYVIRRSDFLAATENKP